MTLLRRIFRTTFLIQRFRIGFWVSAGAWGGSNYWTVLQCYSVMLCGYLVYVYDIYIYILCI